MSYKREPSLMVENVKKKREISLPTGMVDGIFTVYSDCKNGV